MTGGGCMARDLSASRVGDQGHSQPCVILTVGHTGHPRPTRAREEHRVPRIVTPHPRFRPAAVFVLALVSVSLALLIPRGTFAGPIEDRLRESLQDLDTSDLQTGVLYDRVLPLS